MTKEIIENMQVEQIIAGKERKSFKMKDLAKEILTNDEINTPYKDGSKKPYYEQKEINGEKGLKDIDGKILEQADTAPFAGYLYIKEYSQLRIDKKIKLYNVDTVYQMVAETWHEKPETPEKCKNKCWDIHHISNDGYDNRPENLIYLKRCQHKFIHPRMGFTECCKNCDISKSFYE